MNITRRALLQLGCGAVLLNVRPGGARAETAHAETVRVLTGPAFGSAWRLVLPDTLEAAGARARVEAVVARTDARMSPYRRDSELGTFNAGGAVVLSAETRLVTEAALNLARDSDGAFDPTLAPWGRRYGFGPTAISTERPAGRFQDLRLSGNRLTTLRPGLSLDLCAIAKGYALDEITRALDGLDFLIELGGEVAASGRHPEKRPWRVGIERPGTAKLQRVIEADNRALATSGNGAQGYRVDSKRYAHVLDSRRQKPVDNGVASVSVLAATGLMADALATSALVLGPDKSRALLDAYDASALFLIRDPAGSDRELKEVDVRGFVRRQPS